MAACINPLLADTILKVQKGKNMRLTPKSPEWFSEVEAALTVDNVDAVSWAYEADAIIVGLGGAGVACALQGLEEGLSVVAIDRFDGGGATVASGGVIYAGGGTAIQQAAGIDDDVENMFNYLKMETGNIVKDSTLRDFCKESAPTIDWMISHGTDLRPTLYPHKTSFPAPQYFLYHSDNSLISPYRDKARPAARGHRGYVPFEQGKKAMGLGNALFNPLLDSARKLGLDVMTNTEVRQMVTDTKGRVVGVKALRFSNDETLQAYLKVRGKASKLLSRIAPAIPGSGFFLKKARKLQAEAQAMADGREEIFIRARKGVVLSAGGFIFNKKMLEHYAPKYVGAYPLGTDGDSGAGIRLGQTAGGIADNMDRVTAWRFINPPLSFARGLIVNQQGKRFINEMSYGATMGIEIIENQNGEAWLILDKPLAMQALEDVKGDKALNFQRILAKIAVRFTSKKANTLEGLCEKIGVPIEALRREIEDYNGIATGRNNDPFMKTRDDAAEIVKPPFYAINVGLSAKLLPCSTLTLGGLRVDEKTGAVLNDSGKPVKGLYAAGRNAIGVASWRYVSGLSIADGVYSGRRAARAMAKAT